MTQNLHVGIRSLTFQNSDFTDSILLELLQMCSGLEELKFQQCNTIFMAGLFNCKNNLESSMKDVKQVYLPKLQTLHFESVLYLSDTVLISFFNGCENICDLQISSCKITTQETNDTDCCSQIRKVMTSFSTIQDFITLKAHQIHSLNFNSTRINDNVLKEMCETPKLQLKYFNIGNCSILTTKSITTIFSLQPNLETLDLTNVASTIATVCTVGGLLKLQSLNIDRCRIEIKGMHLFISVVSHRNRI